MPSRIGLISGAGVRRPEKSTSELVIAEDGAHIPVGVLAQAGISPDEDLVCEVSERGLCVRSDALRKIYVEVTSLCNLACATCVRHAWDEPLGHMPLDRFERMLKGIDLQASPSREPLTLAFGGYGEPLIHPDFLDLVHLACGAGARVEVTTNGLLLAPDMGRALLDLGVAQVAVSLDGPDQATYGDVRHGELAPVLHQLATLRELKRRTRSTMRVGLAFVAMRRNVDSLPSLLNLAARLDLDFVSISNVIPHTKEMIGEILCGRAAWMAGFPPASWRPRVTLAQMDQDETTRSVMTAIWGETASIPPPNFDADGWRPWSDQRNHCRFAHDGVLAVGWDGRVAPCLSLLHTHPEYINGHWKEVRHYPVGHVDQMSLADIWRQSGYRDFRQRVRAFDFPACFICGGCPSTAGNLEDCYDDPFPVCGECLWAQNIVLCP